MEQKFQQLPKYVTPEVFAEKAGMSVRNLHRIRIGDGAMSYENAVEVARAFESFGVVCQPEELRHPTLGFRGRGQPRKPPQVSEASPLQAVGTPFLTDLGRLVNVPVYRYIAAGPLTDEALVEEDEPMTVVEADARFRFFLVSGRSMEPDIEAGDTLKVDEHRAPKEGLTAIVQIDEGSTVGILRYKGRKLIRIEKAAPGFRDILIKPGMTVQIKGVVDEIIRRKKVQPAPR